MTRRPFPTTLIRAKRQSPRDAGFSLAEMLVYLALGTVLATVAAITVVTNIRTETNFELRQRGVDDFSRLNLFLQSEISEGEWIEYNTETLPKECDGGQPLFTIVLPNPLNPAEPPAARIQEPMPRIYYFTRENGADLWRCGPPFDPATGALMVTVKDNSKLSEITPARVNADTRLTLVNTDDDRTLQYTIELRSRNGTVTLQRGTTSVPLVAHTGVRAIE